MNEAGFDVTPVEMDLSSRESIQALIAEGQKYGEIKMLVNAAGVSPSQAPIEAILKVDLYGTAVLLEEVGKVIAPGGVGVTISSQSGWRMPALTAEQGEKLAAAEKFCKAHSGLIYFPRRIKRCIRCPAPGIAAVLHCIKYCIIYRIRLFNCCGSVVQVNHSMSSFTSHLSR